MLHVPRLRVLHAVSRHGSIAAAATALGYSGPAVSQQLAALEREVGMPLTERVGRTVALTPAARTYWSPTPTCCSPSSPPRNKNVAQFAGQVSGLVRVAAFPSGCCRADAPPPGPKSPRTARHVQIQLEEMEPEESVPALLNHRIDLAVAHAYDLLPRPLPAPYEVRTLLDEPVLLAVPTRQHPATSDIVDLAAMADEPFLLPRAGTSCAEMIHRGVRPAPGSYRAWSPGPPTSTSS